MTGLRYDDPRATPEFIARERARKRLANRREWVEKWMPRIEEEIRGNNDSNPETNQRV